MNIEFQNRRYLWLRGRDLREVDHAEIVDNLVQHGFNGVVVLASTRSSWFYDTALFPQSDERIDGEHLFPHFIRLAHAAGLRVYKWFMVAEWARWQHALMSTTPVWNIANDPDIGHGDNWLNLTRPDVRRAVVDVAQEALELDIDGVLLDYIRFNSGSLSNLHPHVTQTVRDVREMMEADYPGRELLATCFRAVDGWSGRTRYETYSQHWPMWLRRNLLDHVFVSVYRGPDTLHSRLAGLPADERVSIKLTPGGFSKIPEPFTESELREMFDIVENARLFLPVLWNYGLMTPQAWRLHGEYAERYK